MVSDNTLQITDWLGGGKRPRKGVFKRKIKGPEAGGRGSRLNFNRRQEGALWSGLSEFKILQVEQFKRPSLSS